MWTARCSSRSNLTPIFRGEDPQGSGGWTGKGEKTTGGQREVETIPGTWQFDYDGTVVFRGHLTFESYDGGEAFLCMVSYHVTYRTHSG